MIPTREYVIINLCFQPLYASEKYIWVKINSLLCIIFIVKAEFSKETKMSYSKISCEEV